MHTGNKRGFAGDPFRRRSLLSPRGYAERRAVGWWKPLFWGVIIAWLAWFFFGDTIRAGLKARFENSNVFSPLQVSLDASGPFHRYEQVPVALSVRDRQGHPIAECRPEVRVFQGTTPLRDTGERRQLPLRFDKSRNQWLARWAMPVGTRPGEYEFEVAVVLPRELVGTAPTDDGTGSPPTTGPQVSEHGDRVLVRRRVPFTVGDRAEAELPPSICAVTLETDLDIRNLPFMGPTGVEGDWRTLLDWVQFIGGDTVWIQGPTTDARLAPIDPDWPWAADSVRMIDGFAEECHARGLKLGVWVVAMRVFGPMARLPAYRLGAYQRQLEAACVSLLEPRRIDDLASVVKWLGDNDGVDYIGLDYIRDEPPAYDCVDQFVSDLDPAVPDQWGTMGPKEKERWVRTQCANWNRTDEGRQLFRMWNWWRAHRMAEIVAQVLKEADVSKPVWGFTLSWNHGIEHGQDPFMLADAGLDFDAVMLYQIEGRERYDAMMRAWREYTEPEEVVTPATEKRVEDLTPVLGHGTKPPELRPVHLNLVVGNQVDDYHHQRARAPIPAPDEYYRRLRDALESCMTPPSFVRGVFVHDLWRLATREGDKGPYPGTEWAIAGARAMSDVRANCGDVPVRLEVIPPETVAIGQPFRVEVKVTHLGTWEAVRGIDIRPLPMDGVRLVSSQPSVMRLFPGDSTSRTAECVVEKADGRRYNRFMVAFRADYPTSQGFPNVTSYAYVLAK